MKILTLSYDDGIHQDMRFITLLKKYGLKCTFNINTGELGAVNWMDLNGRRVDHIRFKEEELKTVYDGFEVAVHTLHHPSLDKCDEKTVIDEVGTDCKNLERIFGCRVAGMAYPGGNFYTDETIRIITENTPVRYARTIHETLSFGFPERQMEWKPTVYHLNDKLFELAEKFVALPAEEDALFYVWGHSYEFDFTDDGWQRIERFMKIVSNRDDVVYATNQGVLDFMQNAQK